MWKPSTPSVNKARYRSAIPGTQTSWRGRQKTFLAGSADSRAWECSRLPKDFAWTRQYIAVFDGIILQSVKLGR